jgi:hypothetical protein
MGSLKKKPILLQSNREHESFMIKNNNKIRLILHTVALFNMPCIIPTTDTVRDQERKKFIQQYQCSLDLEKRSDFILAGQDYFDRLQKHPISFFDQWIPFRKTPYEQAKNTPMYQRAGFFHKNTHSDTYGHPHHKGIYSRNGYTPASASLCDDSASKFYIKGESIDRIINGQRMKHYLEKNKLHNFKVAQEYINNQGKKLIVISEQVRTAKKYKPISLPIIQQMVKIAQETGYADWQVGYNLLEDDQGNYVFVDLEDHAFNFLTPKDNDWSNEQLMLEALESVQRSTQDFEHRQGINIMDDQAQAWIDMKVNEMKKKIDDQGMLRLLRFG